MKKKKKVVFPILGYAINLIPSLLSAAICLSGWGNSLGVKAKSVNLLAFRLYRISGFTVYHSNQIMRPTGNYGCEFMFNVNYIALSCPGPLALQVPNSHFGGQLGLPVSFTYPFAPSYIVLQATGILGRLPKISRLMAFLSLPVPCCGFHHLPNAKRAVTRVIPIVGMSARHCSNKSGFIFFQGFFPDIFPSPTSPLG